MGSSRGRGALLIGALAAHLAASPACQESEVATPDAGAGSCTPGEQGPCGECGTRSCGADGVWGACRDEGPCAPDAAGADGGADGADGAPADGELDGAGPVEGGPALDGAATCTFAPRTAPIVVYYGTIKDDDGTQRPDLTFQLANPGLDSVFTIGGGSIFTAGEPSAPGDPGTGAFKEYHERCMRIARHMGTGEVSSCLRRRSDLVDDQGRAVNNPCEPYQVAGGTGADDLAAFWKAKLDLGWDYIAIDEIKSINISVAGGGSIYINFTNGGTEAKRFASALDKLAAQGYDRHVFVFFVPHSASGPPANLPDYKDLLTACRDHCRTIQVELYYKTTEVEAGISRNFNAYATALHNLGINNINRVTTAIIAVGNDDGWEMLDHAPCDIAPWKSLSCPALPGSGGIAKQLSAMHSGSYSRYWWGVGFYKIGAVRSKTGYWTKADFVQSLASRLDWWTTHTQP